MKKKIKIALDFIMGIFIVLEFQRGFTGPLFHEIIGIFLLVLFILHNILNLNYYKNMFKGKYNLKRITMLVINTLFTVTMVITIITGIMSSTELFSNMFTHTMTILTIHHVMPYWSLLSLGMHIGINFSSMLPNIKKGKIYNVIAIIIVAFGIYSFISLNIVKYLFGFIGFGVFGNTIINIIKFISIIASISILTNVLHLKVINSGKK